MNRRMRDLQKHGQEKSPERRPSGQGVDGPRVLAPDEAVGARTRDGDECHCGQTMAAKHLPH